jgi:hypothetical protein
MSVAGANQEGMLAKHGARVRAIRRQGNERRIMPMDAIEGI